MRDIRCKIDLFDKELLKFESQEASTTRREAEMDGATKVLRIQENVTTSRAAHKTWESKSGFFFESQFQYKPHASFAHTTPVGLLIRCTGFSYWEFGYSPCTSWSLLTLIRMTLRVMDLNPLVWKIFIPKGEEVLVRTKDAYLLCIFIFNLPIKIKLVHIYTCAWEILKSRYGTVPPNISKFVIFVCVLIKCCVCVLINVCQVL